LRSPERLLVWGRPPPGLPLKGEEKDRRFLATLCSRSRAAGAKEKRLILQALPLEERSSPVLTKHNFVYEFIELHNDQ
jgi:hypothetical protein